MNIILKEIRLILKPLFFWFIGIVVFSVASFMKMSTLSSDPESLNTVIAVMPRIVRIMFGLNNQDLVSPTGILSMVMYYILIILTIYSSLTGTSLILREEKDKTSEFLLVKPVSKSTIFYLKTIAGIIMLITLCLGAFLSSYFSLKYFMETSEFTGTILRYTVVLLISSIFFLGIGTLIGALVRKLKTGTNISLALFGVSFISLIISQVTDSFEVLGKINPLMLVHNQDFFDNNLLYIKSALILVCSLLFIILGALKYKNRDIFV